MAQKRVNTFLPAARIYAGVAACHFFIVDGDGVPFAIGQNYYGQLGLGDAIDRTEPTRLDFFGEIGEEVKQIACGSSHTLFLTTSGDVFSCGNNTYGRLGHKDTVSRFSPEKIELPPEVEIIEVDCGWSNGYCLTSKGKVYSIGFNGYGQLGDGTSIYSTYPVLVLFSNEEKIVRISAGYYHVAAMTSDGSILTFGLNREGQLGRDGLTSIPAKIERLPANRKPAQVICFGNHTNVIYSRNEVYSFGYNHDGRLGLGNNAHQIYPTRVRYFDNHGLKRMSSGGGHTVSILESGDVLAYGYNAYCQLCLGDSAQHAFPTKLPTPLVQNYCVVDVVCGYVHTVLVTEDGCCYGVGDGYSFGREIKRENLTVPKKLFENVDLGAPNQLAQDMIAYILEENQATQQDDVITTDMVLKIGKNEVLRLNKALAQVRCHMSLFDEADPVFKDFEGFREKKEHLLKYLYGHQAENSKSKMEIRGIMRMNDLSFAEAMQALFDEREEDGDVKIVSKGDVKKAHKFVLIARTTYFRSLFRGGFKESYDNIVELEMPMGDDFDAYLHWLYTGKVKTNPDAIERLSPFKDYFG